MDKLYFYLVIWAVISLILWVVLPLLVNIFSIYPFASTNDEFDARDKRRRLIISTVAILALPITVVVLVLFLFIKIVKDVSNTNKL